MVKEEALNVLIKMRAWREWGKEQKEEERPEMPEQKEVDEAFDLCIELLQQHSLPSNLDEVAEEYGRNTFINECMENGVCDDHDLSDAFKAGAEWMAGQGVNIRGRVLPGPHGSSYIESDWFDKRYGGLSWNDEVELTIRKKQ